MKFRSTKLITIIFLSVFVVDTTIANSLDEWLEPTSYIDSDHPAVIRAANEAVGSEIDPKKRAVKIHNFVRDKIRFGWSAAFYNQPASQVLYSGIGFCNTKGTLFVAMLRAVGIPARQHFVTINTEIIGDFISPGSAYVDHSYAEVFLDGEWLNVDSYIVDSHLFNAAQIALKRESRKIGYAIHQNGSIEWDGMSNSFVQFVNDGTIPNLTTTDFGIYADVDEFYASGKALNKLGLVGQLFFAAAKSSANKKIKQLRDESR